MAEPFDAVLAEIGSRLKDAADDYRMVIPQFHAQNRKRMKALASTMDDAIAAFDRLSAAHAAEVAERDARIAELEADKATLLTVCANYEVLQRNTEARAEAAERDAGYLRWRLEEILPLFEEARDALPAITEPMRKLRGIRLDLADRMDAAGTRNREQYSAIATTEQQG